MFSPILEIKNVCFRYERSSLALEDISLSVLPGEYIALTGPNGGGKSTLIRLMLGLIKPLAGTVTLDKDITHNIGFVPQKTGSIGLGFPATVYELVDSGLVSTTLSRDNKKKLVEKALFRLAISDLKDKDINSLSGGQKQRAFLARAVVTNPKLLILDEPTVGVDNLTERDFYQFLYDLHSIHKVTIILITHDLSFVEKHISRNITISQTIIKDTII